MVEGPGKARGACCLHSHTFACFLGQGDGVWRLCRMDSGPSPTGPLMTSVWVFQLLAKRYHTCPDKPFTTTGKCGNTARATGEGKPSEGRNQLH